MMALPSIGQLSTAGPDEILRPVRPWFIVADARSSALAGNLLPLSGVALALRPGFHRARAALLVHPGAALRRRRHRVVRRAGDGRRRCDAVRAARARLRRSSPTPPNISAGACCAFRCGSRRRRWPCCSCLCAGLVLLVRVVGGAPLPRWTYAVPPLVGALLWPLVTVLLQWPQRPQRSSAEL